VVALATGRLDGFRFSQPRAVLSAGFGSWLLHWQRKNFVVLGSLSRERSKVQVIFEMQVSPSPGELLGYFQAGIHHRGIHGVPASRRCR
jgi:hypothetical protein